MKEFINDIISNAVLVETVQVFQRDESGKLIPGDKDKHASKTLPVVKHFEIIAETKNGLYVKVYLSRHDVIKMHDAIEKIESGPGGEDYFD